MIFVTLGSQKFQFNRLLMELDKLKENGKIQEEIYAQIGYSDYKPKNYTSRRFFDQTEFKKYMNESSLVISHGGTGAIVTALKMKKKVIAVPRLTKFSEHVDNHQLQIVNEFKEMNLVLSCIEMKKLNSLIAKAQDRNFHEFKSATHEVVDSIEQFIISVDRTLQ